ncbi:hypothetical protein AGLY_013529, partial [Aphis glycines]
MCFYLHFLIKNIIAYFSFQAFLGLMTELHLLMQILSLIESSTNSSAPKAASTYKCYKNILIHSSTLAVNLSLDFCKSLHCLVFSSISLCKFCVWCFSWADKSRNLNCLTLKELAPSPPSSLSFPFSSSAFKISALTSAISLSRVAISNVSAISLYSSFPSKASCFSILTLSNSFFNPESTLEDGLWVGVVERLLGVTAGPELETSFNDVNDFVIGVLTADFTFGDISLDIRLVFSLLELLNKHLNTSTKEERLGVESIPARDVCDNVRDGARIEDCDAVREGGTIDDCDGVRLNLFYLLTLDLTDDFGTKDSVLADISKRAPVSSISSSKIMPIQVPVSNCVCPIKATLPCTFFPVNSTLHPNSNFGILNWFS